MTQTSLPTAHAASFRRPDIIDEPLYVITPIFNPHRYRSRWKHYTNFEKHIIESGAILVVIEATFGARAKVITERVSYKHIILHVRVSHLSEIWLKENLINIAFAHLPEDWKYVCWVDADIQFMRPDWVGETLHQLQRFAMVQMFSQIAQLSPTNEIIGTGPSFMAGYLKAYKAAKVGKANTYTDGIITKLEWQGAPGGAWAATREAIDHLGGLIDCVILGSGDYFMSLGLLGALEIDVRIGYHNYFMEELLTWQERAVRYLKKNIGLVPGMITHAWHGKMSDRGYGDRWKILVKHNFNPRVDLKKDSSGVYQLTDEKPDLRDDIRIYFSQRNEDSIDV